jgi:hypothetical protein
MLRNKTASRNRDIIDRRYSDRISAETPAILAEMFVGFLIPCRKSRNSASIRLQPLPSKSLTSY